MNFSSSVPTHIRSRLLIEYLANRFTYHSREDWLLHITAGRVLINMHSCVDVDLVCAGDVVTYIPLPFEEPPANFNYSIVYEDEFLLGINKPAGLLVHRAGMSFRNNLIHHLRTMHEPPFPVADTINRIDRDTSGVVLVSKERSFRAQMGILIQGGNLGKLYHAVVSGIVEKRHQVVDGPIAQDPAVSAPCRFMVDVQNGKVARTEITVETYLGNTATLVAVKPIQGRTHQIRVHCASIGHPILGDRVYGGEFGGIVEFNRQALHCSQVRFVHPVTQVETTITAPLARDIADFITTLTTPISV